MALVALFLLVLITISRCSYIVPEYPYDLVPSYDYTNYNLSSINGVLEFLASILPLTGEYIQTNNLSADAGSLVYLALGQIKSAKPVNDNLLHAIQGYFLALGLPPILEPSIIYPIILNWLDNSLKRDHIDKLSTLVILETGISCHDYRQKSTERSVYCGFQVPHGIASIKDVLGMRTLKNMPTFFCQKGSLNNRKEGMQRELHSTFFIEAFHSAFFVGDNFPPLLHFIIAPNREEVLEINSKVWIKGQGYEVGSVLVDLGETVPDRFQVFFFDKEGDPFVKCNGLQTAVTDGGVWKNGRCVWTMGRPLLVIYRMASPETPSKRRYALKEGDVLTMNPRLAHEHDKDLKQFFHKSWTIVAGRKFVKSSKKLLIDALKRCITINVNLLNATAKTKIISPKAYQNGILLRVGEATYAMGADFAIDIYLQLNWMVPQLVRFVVLDEMRNFVSGMLDANVKTYDAVPIDSMMPNLDLFDLTELYATFHELGYQIGILR